MQKLWRSLGAYGVICTLGTIGGLLFWFFYAIGLIRVKGYWKLWREVYRGNHIIAANHPTLLETVILPMMFWPFALIMPKRFFVWSVPDGALFPSWLQWLYNISHCVKVDRANKGNTSAVKTMLKVLRSSATLVVHPEGGRTDSPVRGKDVPHKPFGVNPERGTKIRRIQSRVPDIAAQTRARISPVFIDVPFKNKSNGFKKALWVWVTGLYRITLRVGDAYTVDDKADFHQNNKELARRILAA